MRVHVQRKTAAWYFLPVGFFDPFIGWQVHVPFAELGVCTYAEKVQLGICVCSAKQSV